jgi:hypothetical protein
MKASEALQKLIPLTAYDWRPVRSKVDETKVISEMLQSWINLFEAYPNMTIKSIMKYNVNKDFNCL